MLGKAQHDATMALECKTILLVEDEAGVRSLARLVLQRCGYKVIEGRDGLEALQVAQQYPEQIDLLLTDVMMPHMGGLELAKQLTSVKPDLKVLYVSGYTDEVVVRQGSSGAKVAFLQKPFNTSALSAKVRELLDDQDVSTVSLQARPEASFSDY
jgi:two-component system, cell cycle sensor histidine kinase and response regulator CckA